MYLFYNWVIFPSIVWFCLFQMIFLFNCVVIFSFKKFNFSRVSFFSLDLLPSKLVWEYLHTTSRSWVFESFYVKHDGFWISSLLSRTCFCFSCFLSFGGMCGASKFFLVPSFIQWVAPHVYACSCSSFSIAASNSVLLNHVAAMQKLLKKQVVIRLQKISESHDYLLDHLQV